ncbi:MAG: NFACT RNA binding domain-containing protein [Pseudomonadota bacterium]|nr:NFACT RNA binding domain-containing protein [Pseudomonadota bacterium]
MDMTTIDLLLPGLQKVLPGSFIRKVHQMTGWHLLFKLGGRHGSHNLLCSLAPIDPGLHISTGRFFNPPRPLRFCAFLRHHLQGAMIQSIEKIPNDRIIIIRSARASGDPLALIIELTGKRGNLIFARGESLTIEELLLPHHPAAANRLRQGENYTPPPLPPELNKSAETGKKSFLEAAIKETDNTNPLFYHQLYDRWFLPRYREKYDIITRQQIISHLRKKQKRLKRKIGKVEREAADKQQHLKLEPFGELLKSSLHRIKRGDREAKVINYWSPDLEEVNIPLDPALSPIQNLEKLYKRVKKAKRGLAMIETRLATSRGELHYLEDLAYQVEQSRNQEELSEYATILGISAREHGRQPHEQEGREKKTHAGRQLKGVNTEQLASGATITIGKSAAGNEEIYRHLSSANDLWFHAKDIPGAHVLLKTPNDRPATETEIKAAAKLAAINSRGKNDTRVEIMYLPRKYLKKPKGGRPGQVLIHGPQQTITVKLTA